MSDQSEQKPVSGPIHTDVQETREWMDALSAVIDKEGPERAHVLLEPVGRPLGKHVGLNAE